MIGLVLAGARWAESSAFQCDLAEIARAKRLPICGISEMWHGCCAESAISSRHVSLDVCGRAVLKGRRAISRAMPESSRTDQAAIRRIVCGDRDWRLVGRRHNKFTMKADKVVHLLSSNDI